MSAEDGELPLGRRNGKSDAAFRTISEVADELDVPQHVLRFWESKFPQVKPLKRGGGRRYYRPEDVALLRRIRDLLYSEGYTIKGVQKLLREGGAKESAAKSEPEAAEPQPELGFSPQEEDEGADDTEIGGMADEDGETCDAAEATAAALADLSEEEDPAMDECTRNTTGETVSETRLAPEIRKELKYLLDELEQLRGLLLPRR